MDVVPRFEGRGRVTLTASTELEYAFEEAGRADSVSELGASAPGSIFTRFLVEGIRTGAADANRDGEISIDELYDFVYAKVREYSPHQTPGKGGGGYGDLIIAHGRKASLQVDVRQALDSPLAGVREATVAELARMRAAANPGMQRTIDKALRGLLDDDSLRVREAAASALEKAPAAQHGPPPTAGPPPTTGPPPTAAPPSGAPLGGRSPPPAPAATPPGASPRSPARTLRGRRGILVGVLAVALAGAVVAIVATSGGSGDSNGSSADSTINLPPNPARGTLLGSDLTPTELDTCLSGGETCSVVQYALPGRPTVASATGVINRWSARGKGRVALQAVTLTPTHASASSQSNFVTLTGNGPQSFTTHLPIKKGDFIALLVCPNARVAIGGGGASGSIDLRWAKGLLIGQPRARSEIQPESLEYAFNATIDTSQTATSTGASPGPCPAA